MINAGPTGDLAVATRIRKRDSPERSPLSARRTGRVLRVQEAIALRSHGDEPDAAAGVSGLFWFLWSAAGIVTVLAALAAWVLVRPESRRARIALFAVSACYLASSLYVVSHPAGQLLAAGYRPLVASDVPRGRTAIVLLGSGIFTAKAWDGSRYSVLDRTTAPRVLEAFRLYQSLQPAWVVSSGGNLRDDSIVEPAGLTMRTALIQLGVPPERIAIETRSKTTRDEATIIKEMLPGLAVDHVVLVTTQLHMRRSVGVFRAAGITVIPAIAPEPTGLDDWWAWLLPTDAGFNESKALVHEVAGILYYAVRGWYRY